MFHRTRTKIFKLVWKYERLAIAKAVLRKRNRARRIRFPDFRLYHKGPGIKTVWYWQKKKTHKFRSMEQDSPEVNPGTYGQVFYDKEGKKT